MTQHSGQPIFLIGFRGSGKSTVARLLAERLGYEWIDSDDRVEQQAGQRIADIFAEEGEPAFREAEARVVAELSRQQRTVVALGGGAVLRQETQEAIRAAGPVVWLTADVDTLERRLAGDPATADRRPPLTDLEGRAEIEDLLARREPVYRACATFEVDTQNRSPAEVVEAIVANLDAQP